MTRRRRYLFWGGSVFTLVTVLVMLVPLVTQGASQYADPAFTAQWQSVESTIPNFWGPLSTARDGQAEPYVEGTYGGQVGSRLVQYFDKARMELTNPATGKVTNGLLTVELTTGTLQLGDNTFQQYPGAGIGIAGDPGQPGPTYASLGELPPSNPQTTGSVSLVFNVTTNSFTSGTPSTDPNAVFSSYLSDPSGRFGQNIPKAFTDFLAKIPGGALPALGYPISAPFMASITVNGTANVPVIIQAFQRKVLTYTPSNQSAFQVEFGNIGQHYYQWRYIVLTGAGATASAAACSTATFTPTSTGTATATPKGTLTPTATTTPICVPYVAPTVCATATSTPGTGVATSTPTATVGIGTPFPTDAAFGNVCATSTPSGTSTPTVTTTPTITSTPDATGTTIAGTATSQANDTATAQANSTGTASARANGTSTASAQTSTANAPANGATSTAAAAAATLNAQNASAQTRTAATITAVALTGTPPIPVAPTRKTGPDLIGTATAAAKTATAGATQTAAAKTATVQMIGMMSSTSTPIPTSVPMSTPTSTPAPTATLTDTQQATATALQVVASICPGPCKPAASTAPKLSSP